VDIVDVSGLECEGILAKVVVLATMRRMWELRVPKAQLSVIHGLVLKYRSLKLRGRVLRGGFYDFLASGNFIFPHQRLVRFG